MENENETELKSTKWVTWIIVGAWLWFALVGFLLWGCTTNVTLSNNNASGHAVEKTSEKVSEKKDIDTKIDSEVEGKGSIFGF